MSLVSGFFDFERIVNTRSRTPSASQHASRRWLLLLALLSFCGLSAVGVIAATYTFDCTDVSCGPYLNRIIQITTTTDDFGDVRNSADNMPWWHDSTLAQGMAASLGYTGTGSNRVLFAYNYTGRNDDRQVFSAYGVSAGGAGLTTNSYGSTRTYVTGFQDLGHNPEIDGRALPTVVLLLASLFLLFRQRALH